jgi:tetratricopeptide (TPR) repeat protein
LSSKYKYPFVTIFLFFITIQFTYAQQVDFDKSILKLTEEKPTSFSEIDAILKPFEKDSIKMKSALGGFKTNEYNEGASYALNALGVINRNLSNYNKSVKLHKQAYSFADKANNDEFRIVSLNMIGVAFRRMDMIKYALDNHTGALKIAYEYKDPTPTVSYNIAVSQNSIGNIYLALEQYDAALDQFKKSLAIEENGNNQLGLAINYHNIGYAHEGKGNLDLALANYEKSLFYNEAIDSEIGRMICFNSIGGIYLKKGRICKSRANY